jgi:hypothetical protein
MARDTTQAAPAAGAAAAGALDPGALFTLEEAAGRVRVPVEDLEARCDRGELLYETRRRGRKEVRCVRGLDLAEAFPGAPGAAKRTPPPSPQQASPQQPSPPQSDTEPAVPGGADAPSSADQVTVSPSRGDQGDGIAEAVRSSGASRDALIGLCQDLETRLDLAERERQASTASLLMAQRRVLELELQERSRPWRRASAAALGLMSVSALTVTAMLPGWLEDRAADREVALRSQLDGDLARLQASMGAMVTASGEERAALAARLEASSAALDDERRRVEQLMAGAADERSRAEAARLAGLEQLGALEERLEESDRQAVRRTAELGVIVEASARDRARFDERIAASERSTAAARAALSEAQESAALERAEFQGQLSAVEDRRAAELAARTAEIESLRGEVRSLMGELQTRQAEAVAVLEAAGEELKAQLEARPPVEVWTLKREARESWWTRALRSMTAR